MRAIKEFLQLESAAGLILIFSTALALVAANGPAEPLYGSFLDTTVAVIVGKFEIKKPLLLWINDGLMAVFFFLVALELKREVIKGHLSSIDRVLLPGIAAIGGIVVPALIFYFFNRNDDVAVTGWAIPAATDIAFALGMLSLCAKKVPTWAKLFLLSLAILDDLAAIIIIALFYTDNISVTALIFAVIGLMGLTILKQRKTKSLFAYILIGFFLWVAVLKSGVHATLAGVMTAFFIPVSKKTQELEHNLHPWVAFGILPLFAFSNTGINLTGMSMEWILHPVTLGCALGLFVGKQLGVFLFAAIPIYFKKIPMPKGGDYKTIYGLAALSGIGFTMSLFISSLSYGDVSLSLLLKSRTGIIIGSLGSCIIGYMILTRSFKYHQKDIKAHYLERKKNQTFK